MLIITHPLPRTVLTVSKCNALTFEAKLLLSLRLCVKLYCFDLVDSVGRANASKPCSVVRITASPTMIGDAELVSSSPVGRELTCLPSFKPRTTPSELERGVKRGVSATVKGCAAMRPGNSFFQTIEPLRLSRYAKLSSEAASSASPASTTASTPAPVRLRHF